MGTTEASAAVYAAMVGSTLCWSAFDALRKGLVGRFAVDQLAFWIAVAQIPGFAVWSLFVEGSGVGAAYWAPAAISMALNLAANVLFLVSVRHGPISVAVPVLAYTPVFVALSSIPLLGERLEAAQWAGVALVAFGSLFLTADPGDSLRPDRLARKFLRSPGVAPMFGVAILWSLSPLFDKLALRHTSVGLHGLLLALSGATGMATYLRARGRPLAPRQRAQTWALLAVGGCVNVAALGLQLLSISAMLVSVFEAFKRAIGVTLAIALGALVFRESISKTRTLAALFMAIGVVLVLRGGSIAS